MNIARVFAAAILAGATFGLAGCGGGVEGTYTLDKAEVKRTMEAEMKEMRGIPLPPGLVKIAIGMIDAMEMSMELQPGGKLKMKATMPSLGPGQPGTTENKEGTWAADGQSIVLTADGKAIKCSKSWGRLSCESERKGDPGLIFVKS